MLRRHLISWLFLAAATLAGCASSAVGEKRQIETLRQEAVRLLAQIEEEMPMASPEEVRMLQFAARRARNAQRWLDGGFLAEGRSELDAAQETLLNLFDVRFRYEEQAKEEARQFRRSLGIPESEKSPEH